MFVVNIAICNHAAFNGVGEHHLDWTSADMEEGVKVKFFHDRGVLMVTAFSVLHSVSIVPLDGYSAHQSKYMRVAATHNSQNHLQAHHIRSHRPIGCDLCRSRLHHLLDVSPVRVHLGQNAAGW